MTKVLGGRGGLGKFHLTAAGPATVGAAAAAGRGHRVVPSHRKTASSDSVATFVDGAAEAAEATAAVAAAAEGGERGMARRAMAQSFLSASKGKATVSRMGEADEAPAPPLFHDVTVPAAAVAVAAPVPPMSAMKRRERVVVGGENPVAVPAAKSARMPASPAVSGIAAVARTPLAPRVR